MVHHKDKGAYKVKFPYGISDFFKINTQGYYYCDRTDKIPLLEQADSQLFIRPRRFGKSLVLSMLENYYDVEKAKYFKELFGNLAIGKNPTKLHNSYFILKWDFSCIDTSGSVEKLQRALFDHINSCIRNFLLYYRDYNLPHVKIDENNCINSIQSLIGSVRMTKYPIYLFIDEYDNFANTIMMGVQSKENKTDKRYDALVYDEGILRTLFKAVKASKSDSIFDRIFITGVSPVVLSDITSGYNIAENIYFHPKLNDLCGFREHEIKEVIKKIVKERGFNVEKINEILGLMKTYYNGYCFTYNISKNIYNPTLCLYFLKYFQEMCEYPMDMLDSNLSVDRTKLKYIATIPTGSELIIKKMQKNEEIAISKISDRFGLEEMLSDESKDNAFLISFLYYFGVLTLMGENSTGDVVLKIPNLVVESLFVEQIQLMLLPKPLDRDNGKLAAKQVYQCGNIQPLCDFVENQYFTVFKNRDYRWANELTVKTAFLTLLYNDILYIMDSEAEINRRYADLTMIIRPDKKYLKIFDVLIEFKFISLQDAKLTGKQVRQLSEEELYNMPLIKAKLEEGEQQVTEYAQQLNEKYGNLRLKKFVVASLGFERICFK